MNPEEKSIAVKKFMDLHECNIEDHVYGKVGGIELVATIYTPKIKPSELTKAIVYVHGGGWVGGGRDHFNSHGAYFASKGIVGVCITYRLVPDHKFPAQIQDANCAIRWTRKNTQELNIDPNEIYVCGSSAGGHIAGIVAYAGAVNAFDAAGGNEGVSSDVKGAILFCGYYESREDILEPRAPKPNKVSYFGGTYDEIPEVYQQASCVSYVNKHSPRTLLFHGDADGTVSFEHSKKLKDALDLNNVENQLIVENGGSHTDYSFEKAAFMTTLKEMEKFIL
ncbi:MAG: hypothetical protein COA79_07425 [Planctomycetota bacterium]|nr:MAG: hypothetical protein COA79_07425 [Planctomycetota bacterium]